MSNILEEKRIPERLYEFNPNGCCGFFMPEHVMKKLAKMTVEFNTEVRRVLSENKDELHPLGWNLAYPNGKQTAVYFAEPETGFIDKDHLIKMFKADQPIYRPEVYAVRAFSPEAEAIIKAIEERDSEASK